MTALLASPEYKGDLGNGLIRRWSTAADQEKIATCMATVFRDSEDEPLNERVANEARIVFAPGFPLMGPGDFAIVEDTQAPGSPVVACVCYWRHTWSLGGIPFGVGRPEYVATLAPYRNRGLIRALFEMIHARSAERGDLVQAITGIEYYYRQFGYEYVLDLGGRRAVSVAAIPRKVETEPEPYRLRAATADDAAFIHALYSRGRSMSLVFAETTLEGWRYYVTLWDEPVVRSQEPASVGVAIRLYVVVDREDRVCGYVSVGAMRRRDGIGIYDVELRPGINWQAAMPSLLRALHEVALQTPIVNADVPPLKDLNFALGRDHPAYDALDGLAASPLHPPYAWYLRVADVPRFIHHIAPVIEERLANSILAGYSGELKMDFYRGGMRLQFEAGWLAAAESWRTPPYGDVADFSCPGLTFLQLLFGYRSLPELRAIFPDVQVQEKAALAIKVLFPKLPSRVSGMGYT